MARVLMAFINNFKPIRAKCRLKPRLHVLCCRHYVQSPFNPPRIPVTSCLRVGKASLDVNAPTL